MARPRKEGLDYFPLDADIFESDKLFDVQNDYGPLGEIIYMRLLCLVYKNGYYYRFESLDKLAAMTIRSIGSRWVSDKATVIKIISFLAENKLFSEELMRENILTSHGIQKRYLKATAKRKSKICEYNLLDESEVQGVSACAPEDEKPDDEDSETEDEVSAAETTDSVSIMRQSKEKKSKVNETKGNETKEKKNKAPGCVSDDTRAKCSCQSIVEAFNSICVSLPKVKSLSNTRKTAIKRAGRTLESFRTSFEDLFRTVEASDFLTGRNGAWSNCGFDWVMKISNLQKILEGNYDNKSERGNISTTAQGENEERKHQYGTIL